MSVAGVVERGGDRFALLDDLGASGSEADFATVVSQAQPGLTFALGDLGDLDRAIVRALREEAAQ
jgi:hypothetical protein